MDIENNKPKNWWIWIIIILVIWLMSVHDSLGEKDDMIADLDYENRRLERLVSDYSDALAEANEQLEEAQYYAWSDYYDMGYILENLYPVSEP